MYTDDMLWRNFLSPQCRNSSREGRFSIGTVGLAMVSQSTKFKVSRFTRYEAMNGGAKCRKWGGFGQLGDSQGHRQCHHLIERIRLPIRL